MDTGAIKEGLTALVKMVRRMEQLTIALGPSPEMPVLQETLTERSSLVERISGLCEQLKCIDPLWRENVSKDRWFADLVEEVRQRSGRITREDNRIKVHVRSRMSQIDSELSGLTKRSRAVRSYESHRSR